MRKIKVLYDGTLLAEGLCRGSSRSGIFFVVYNVFKELLKFDDLEILLYSDPARLEEMKAFIWYGMHAYHGNITIVNDPGYRERPLSLVERAVWKMLALCACHCSLRSTAMRDVLAAFKIVLRRICGLVRFRIRSARPAWQAILSEVDAVLSPAFPHTPEVIDSGVRRYTILYDAIPYIFPDLFPDAKYGCSWNLNLLTSLNGDDVCFAISQQTKDDFLYFSKLFREKGNDLLAMFEERHGVNPYTVHIVDALRDRRRQGLLPMSEVSANDTPLKAENIDVMLLAASDMFHECKDPEHLLAICRKYGIPAGKKYIFSLCTLERRKNILYAIRNFLKFIEENHIDDMVFVLGGGSWMNCTDELEREISDLPGWQERILRIGYVDDDDLTHLFSGAFCTVYPSIYEGFGLPPLEAMQCGCPVITSDNSSLPEVVGDAGVMIDVSQPEALKQAIKRLYDNPTACEELVRRGLERAKRFSWEASARVVHDRIVRDCGNRGDDI